MTRTRPCRTLRARIGIGVAVLCLAGLAAEPAAAEDPAPIPAAAELASATLDAALESVSESAPLELTVPAVVDALPATTATEVPAAEVPAAPVPTPTDTAPAAEPPSPPAPVTAVEPVTAPQSVPAPVSPPQPVLPEPASPPVTATATQAQPANLNVAVRVDSPGDNGAVEQVNAVIVSVSGARTAAEAAQYQPPAPQYQPPQTPAAPPDPDPVNAAPVVAEPGWAWTWTCGGTVTDLLGSGNGAALLPANWTWNWNWNCGDDNAVSTNNDPEINTQYHPGVVQYQPVNLNVSIRIGSPGNDGPVTQSNVSVVVVTPPIVVPYLPAPLPALPVPGLPLPPTNPTPMASPASEPAPAEVPGIVLELAAVEIAASIELDDSLEWIFRGPAGGFGFAAAASDLRSSVAARSYVARTPARPAGDGPGLTQRSTSSSALALRAGAVAHAQASVRPDRPARAKPRRSPSRRPALPVQAPVLASGFAGGTSGGADGGGWPLLALLLVPFSLALVDGARRMGRDAALPAAEDVSSRRERPG